MDKLEELYNIVKNMRKELTEKEKEAYQKSKNADNNENRIVCMIQAQEYKGAIKALEKVTDEIINLQFNQKGA